MKICLWCEKNKAVKSHIVPKWVFKESQKKIPLGDFYIYLDPSTGTSRKMGHDGLVAYLLCVDCEKKISKYESKAKNWFVDGNSSISYNDLLVFFLSIVLRWNIFLNLKDKKSELDNILKKNITDFINEVETKGAEASNNRFEFFYIHINEKLRFHDTKTSPLIKKSGLLKVSQIMTCGYIVCIKISSVGDEPSFRTMSNIFKHLFNQKDSKKPDIFGTHQYEIETKEEFSNMVDIEKICSRIKKTININS